MSTITSLPEARQTEPDLLAQAELTAVEARRQFVTLVDEIGRRHALNWYNQAVFRWACAFDDLKLRRIAYIIADSTWGETHTTPLLPSHKIAGIYKQRHHRDISKRTIIRRVNRLRELGILTTCRDILDYRHEFPGLRAANTYTVLFGAVVQGDQLVAHDFTAPLNDDEPPEPAGPVCGQCGDPFKASRSDARFCSARCRQAHVRAIICDNCDNEPVTDNEPSNEIRGSRGDVTDNVTTVVTTIDTPTQVTQSSSTEPARPEGVLASGGESPSLRSAPAMEEEDPETYTLDDLRHDVEIYLDVAENSISPGPFRKAVDSLIPGWSEDDLMVLFSAVEWYWPRVQDNITSSPVGYLLAALPAIWTEYGRYLDEQIAKAEAEREAAAARAEARVACGLAEGTDMTGKRLKVVRSFEVTTGTGTTHVVEPGSIVRVHDRLRDNAVGFTIGHCGSLYWNEDPSPDYYSCNALPVEQYWMLIDEDFLEVLGS